MSGGCIHRHEVGLNQSSEHRLGRASSHDKIEFLDQTNLDRSGLVMSAVIAHRRNVDRAIHEVIPAKDLLSPQFKGEQEVEVTAFSQGHFALTEAEKTLHRLIVIVDVGILDER